MPRKPEPETKKVVMSFRVSPDNRDFLLKRSADTKVSMSVIVDKAVRDLAQGAGKS